jgi:hypothetical protein
MQCVCQTKGPSTGILRGFAALRASGGLTQEQPMPTRVEIAVPGALVKADHAALRTRCFTAEGVYSGYRREPFTSELRVMLFLARDP